MPKPLPLCCRTQNRSRRGAHLGQAQEPPRFLVVRAHARCVPRRVGCRRRLSGDLAAPPTSAHLEQAAPRWPSCRRRRTRSPRWWRARGMRRWHRKSSLLNDNMGRLLDGVTADSGSGARPPVSWSVDASSVAFHCRMIVGSHLTYRRVPCR
jgi:hypothetical protein